MVHCGHWLSGAGHQQTVLVCGGAARHAHVVGESLAIDGVWVIDGVVHESGGSVGVGRSGVAGPAQGVAVGGGTLVVRESEGVVLGQLEVLEDWGLAGHHMTSCPVEVVSVVEAELSCGPGVSSWRTHP